MNKVSPDHIGLLVYGVFNASIPFNEIRKNEFAWDDSQFSWYRKSEEGPLSIETGSVFRFAVKE